MVGKEAALGVRTESDLLSGLCPMSSQSAQWPLLNILSRLYAASLNDFSIP